MTVVEMIAHTPVKVAHATLHLGDVVFTLDSLVREIDERLEERQGPDQVRAPPIIKLRQHARRLTQRLHPLCVRLGIDEICEPLDLGEIEFPVLESPPCEFSGLGFPHPVHAGERLKHGPHHRPPAMNMKLERVFARKALRTFEEESEPTIDHGARPG